MDSSSPAPSPVRRSRRRWLWRFVGVAAILAVVAGGLRIYLEPHFQFRKQHAEYAHLLTPVPVEHPTPVEPPDDWKAVTHFGIRMKLPSTFVPSPTNKTRENASTVVYVEPVSKAGIMVNKPTDGRRDLRQTYDGLEINQNFPDDVRPWQSIYDYWLTIGTASYDQFSWVLSQQHVRELDWILRLREQRIAIELLMTKSVPVYSYALGENKHARWILQVSPNWRNEHFAQIFSKSDHRDFTVNWLDADRERGTDGILRLCNSVRFE